MRILVFLYKIECEIVLFSCLINLSFHLTDDDDIKKFIPLPFKLFNGVNVFIVELFLLYQTSTTGSTLW